MNDGLGKHVAPPGSACRLTVCIPARNEAACIERTLAALANQRDVDGAPLTPGFFDVIVFANNCQDETADVVRRLARKMEQVAVFTIESTLRSDHAHIGMARKQVMDVAAARFFAAGRPEGILASLDSDTIAQPDWIVSIAREMRGADAVAGQVTIASADYESLLAPVRLLYARERTYRRVFAEAEALIDPRAEDPQPRHNSFVGASFAVSARTYIAVGGVPPIPRLEDLAFSHALRRIDARVRHSPAVRASTSARLAARVDGGFGSFLAHLYTCARRGESFCVEHPQDSLDDMMLRAALRRIRRGEQRPDDTERIARILGLSPHAWLPVIASGVPLGMAYERIDEFAVGRRRRSAPALVEFAIATLRWAADAERARRLVESQESLFERQDAG